MAKKTTTKKTDNTKEYAVRLKTFGIVRLEGDIRHEDDSTVVIRYAKHGSSNYEERVIPRSAIVALSGAVNKRSMVMFRGETEVFYKKRCSVEVMKGGKSQITWLSTKGEPVKMTVQNDAFEIVAISNVEKPTDDISVRGAKAKKKGTATKAKK